MLASAAIKVSDCDALLTRQGLPAYTGPLPALLEHPHNGVDHGQGQGKQEGQGHLLGGGLLYLTLLRPQAAEK